MKKAFVALIAIILIAGIGYYLARPADPLLSGIPPRENADGTIDYTLVNKWLYDKEPTYWVLRFPNDQYVRTSENWTGDYKNSSNSVGLHTRPNQYIELYFKDNSLENYLLKSEFGHSDRAGRIEVTVWAEENISATNDGQSLGTGSVRDVNKHCKLVERIAPGVLLYANDVENNDGSIEQAGCAGVGYDHPGYIEAYVLVQNAKGNPVGEFNCGVSQTAVTPRTCLGRFVIGTARMISVSFDYGLLPKALELRGSIEEYLMSKSIKVDTSETMRKQLEPINH
jgi:hypothetical protein